MYGARIADDMPMKLNMPNAVAVICGGALVPARATSSGSVASLPDTPYRMSAVMTSGIDGANISSRIEAIAVGKTTMSRGLRRPIRSEKYAIRSAAGTDVHAVSDETKPVSVAGTPRTSAR